MRRLIACEAKLAKLEKLAGQESCPQCRFLSRREWCDPKKPRARQANPALLTTETCELCGRRQEVDLSKVTEEEREIYRIYCQGSSFEDIYTNPRAWMAREWMINQVSGKKPRKKKSPGAQRAKPSREAKLFIELRDRWFDATERKRKRFVARYGETPFPELAARLEAVKAKDRDHLYRNEPFGWRVPFRPMFDLRQEEEAWLRCAEAEKFLLGHVLPSTRLALEDCDRRALELIEEGRRLHRQEEEKRQQREAPRAQPPQSREVRPTSIWRT